MAWFDRNPGGKKGPEDEPTVAPESPRVSAPPPEPTPAPTKETPPPPKPSLVASLYKGSRVTGQLTFQGAARIDGSVDGEIQCQSQLTIGEGAEVRAKISSQVLVVQGKVEGNVTAKEKIELLAPARLVGNIHTPRLIIAEGVVFDGDCAMGMAKQKSEVANVQSVTAEKAAAVPSPEPQVDSKQ